MVTPTLGNQNKFSSYSEDHNNPFYRVASDFLNSQGTVLPQLQNSHPVSPLVYNDKDGEDRVLVYGVEKEGKIIGRIAVNFDLDNPCFLEFAEVAPPHLSEVKKEATERISLKEGEVLGEMEFIYVFPLLYYIHFPVWKGGTKSSDLYLFWNEKRIVNPNEIPSSLPLPKVNQGQSEIKGYYKILIDVPAYLTTNTNLPNPCGPVAGANILGYWHKKGYPKLQLSSDEQTGAQLTTCLYYDMGTSSIWGSPVGNFRYGVEYHANASYHPPYNCGYHFWTAWQRPATYESLVWEINADRPLCIIMGWPPPTSPFGPYGIHWVVGIGYYQPSNIIYIRDGWSTGTVAWNFDVLAPYLGGYVYVYPSP